MTPDEAQQTTDEFHKVVNMSASALAHWLTTPESEQVGFKTDADAEALGHQSGRQIVGMLQKKPSAYTADEVQHARKVVGYIHRHLAQQPAGDVRDTRWRYSLMNWGHDPLED